MCRILCRQVEFVATVGKPSKHNEYTFPALYFSLSFYLISMKTVHRIDLFYSKKGTQLAAYHDTSPDGTSS